MVVSTYGAMDREQQISGIEMLLLASGRLTH